MSGLTETLVLGLYKLYWLQGLYSYYTLQSNNMSKYCGVTVTVMSNFQQQHLTNNAKCFYYNIISHTTEIQQSCDATLKKYPNFVNWLKAFSWPAHFKNGKSDNPDGNHNARLKIGDNDSLSRCP